MPQLTDDDVARLAALAVVHPRTLLKRYAGLRVRGSAGRRIDAVLAQHLRPVAPEAQTAA